MKIAKALLFVLFLLLQALVLVVSMTLFSGFLVASAEKLDKLIDTIPGLRLGLQCAGLAGLVILTICTFGFDNFITLLSTTIFVFLVVITWSYFENLEYSKSTR